MRGLSLGTLSGFPKNLFFALHEARVLEGLSLFGADRLVDISAVAWVETGSLVVDHLMTALDGAFVLICGPILPADWRELIRTRTIEMRRFRPVKVVTRSLVAEIDVSALEPASGGVRHAVGAAHRVVYRVARTGRVRVRRLGRGEITVVGSLIGDGGHGGHSSLSLAPAVALLLLAEEEHDAEVRERDVVGGTDG